MDILFCSPSFFMFLTLRLVKQFVQKKLRGKAGLKPPQSKRYRDCRTSPNLAKRLDCGRFTAAFDPRLQNRLLTTWQAPADFSLRSSPSSHDNNSLLRGKIRYLPAMQRLKGIFLAAFVLIIFAGGVWLGFTVPRWMKLGSGLHMENTATVVEQVQTLSDLVTVKYVLEKVVILEDVKWYGENRVLLLAHGVVKAGIDLKRITADDVTISGKTIRLRLPPPQIMDAYLDDKNSQVIDHATGLLRAFDKDLEQTARANAVDDIRRAARTDGILDEADKRARLELELFLRQAGFEQVEFC
jgi:hypothetical protein